MFAPRIEIVALDQRIGGFVGKNRRGVRQRGGTFALEKDMRRGLNLWFAFQAIGDRAQGVEERVVVRRAWARNLDKFIRVRRGRRIRYRRILAVLG